MSSIGVLNAGWMTKSPPESKLYSVLSRIYQAKWRRRWFVLFRRYDNVSACDLPFEFLYYEDETCKKCKGKINLSAVHEIVVNFDTDYESTFALKTKHRHRDRTYYLSVSNRDDMMAWVNMLCVCCGLSQLDGESSAEGGSYTISAPTNSTSLGGTPNSSNRSATAQSLERSRVVTPAAAQPTVDRANDQSIANDKTGSSSKQSNSAVVSRTPDGAPNELTPRKLVFVAARRQSDGTSESPNPHRPADNDENCPYVNTGATGPSVDAPPVPLKRHDTVSGGPVKRPPPTAASNRSEDDYLWLTDFRSGTDSEATPNASRSGQRKPDEPDFNGPDLGYLPAPTPRPFGVPFASLDTTDPDSDYLNVPAATNDAPSVVPKRNSASRARLLAKSGFDAEISHSDADVDEDSPSNHYVRPPEVAIPIFAVHASPMRGQQPTIQASSSASKLTLVFNVDRTPELLPKLAATRMTPTQTPTTPTRAIVNDSHASPKSSSRTLLTPAKQSFSVGRSPLANNSASASEEFELDNEYRVLRSHAASSSTNEANSGYLNVHAVSHIPKPAVPSVNVGFSSGTRQQFGSPAGRPAVALTKHSGKRADSSSEEDLSENDDIDDEESALRSLTSDGFTPVLGAPNDMTKLADAGSVVFGRASNIAMHPQHNTLPSFSMPSNGNLPNVRSNAAADSNFLPTPSRNASSLRPSKPTPTSANSSRQQQFAYADLDLLPASSDSPVHTTPQRATEYLDSKSIDFERTSALAKLASERERQLERATTPVQHLGNFNSSTNMNSSLNGSRTLAPNTVGLTASATGSASRGKAK